MSTQTTNVFQSKKFWTFTGNVVAGVLASVLVLWGQGLFDGFVHYEVANPNIWNNSGFIWIIALILLPAGGIIWGIRNAKNPESGRSNREIFVFLGAMGGWVIALVFLACAMMTLQAAVNQQNGH